MARLVVPGYPHHVTQRGNRRQQTFYNDSDYHAYIELLSERKSIPDVEIWAYFLMLNHIHLVAVPEQPQSLAKLLGVTHHRYAQRVNSMHDWRDHLWRERFHLFIMDEAHLLAAVRYIELNSVRAGLCKHAEQWRWSSVHAHLHDKPDKLVNVSPMREHIRDWCAYLSENAVTDRYDSLRLHTRTGRPAGNRAFIENLEALTGKRLQLRKPGPKRNS